jgi:hypothetical protein
VGRQSLGDFHARTKESRHGRCGVGELEFGEVGVFRLDELRAVDRQRLIQNSPKLLSKDNGNGACIVRVNRNGKRACIAIVAVDRSLRLPNAVSVSGPMTIITNQQNFRPKILVQSVLGFDRGQIIAGGNDATVEHDEIVFARRQDNSLLPPATQGHASEKNGAMTNDFRRRREIHGRIQPAMLWEL